MHEITEYKAQIEKLKFDTMIFNTSMLNNSIMKFCIMNNIRMMAVDMIPYGNVDLYLNGDLVFSINLNTGQFIDLS